MQEQTTQNEPLSTEGARNKFLATVQGIVNNDRNKSYGSAEDSFQTIADFWSTYLYTRFGFTNDITVFDVACMMDLMKSARIASNPTHMDSWVDKAGYAACAGGILEQRKDVQDAMDRVGMIDTSTVGESVPSVGCIRRITQLLREHLDEIAMQRAKEVTHVFAYYTDKDGGYWQTLDRLVHLRESEIVEYAKCNGIFALRRPDFRVWDSYEGWRTKE